MARVGTPVTVTKNDVGTYKIFPKAKTKLSVRRPTGGKKGGRGKQKKRWNTCRTYAKRFNCALTAQCQVPVRCVLLRFIVFYCVLLNFNSVFTIQGGPKKNNLTQTKSPKKNPKFWILFGPLDKEITLFGFFLWTTLHIDFFCVARIDLQLFLRLFDRQSCSGSVTDFPNKLGEK